MSEEIHRYDEHAYTHTGKTISFIPPGIRAMNSDPVQQVITNGVSSILKEYITSVLIKFSKYLVACHRAMGSCRVLQKSEFDPYEVHHYFYFVPYIGIYVCVA